MEVLCKLFKGLFFKGKFFIENLVVLSFGKGGSSPIAHLVECHKHLGFVIVDVFVYGEVGCHGLDPVTICGRDIFFSIIHLPPLCPGLPYMFTVSIIFSTDTYQYIIW